MAQPLILIVEDEEDIASDLASGLAAGGYRTALAYDGRTGLSRARELNPDLILLDLNLPVMSGWEFIAAYRRTANTPIIVLTGVFVTPEDEKRALGEGIVNIDYLLKTRVLQNLDVLLARIQRLAPPKEGEVPVDPEGMLRSGSLILRTSTKQAWRDGRNLGLTEREFDILALLARNKGKSFTEDEVFEYIVGPTEDLPTSGGSLKVHISNLRKKLGRPEVIHTRRGLGYYYEEP